MGELNTEYSWLSRYEQFNVRNSWNWYTDEKNGAKNAGFPTKPLPNLPNTFVEPSSENTKITNFDCNGKWMSSFQKQRNLRPHTCQTLYHWPTPSSQHLHFILCIYLCMLGIKPKAQNPSKHSTTKPQVHGFYILKHKSMIFFLKCNKDTVLNKISLLASVSLFEIMVLTFFSSTKGHAIILLMLVPFLNQRIIAR